MRSVEYEKTKPVAAILFVTIATAYLYVALHGNLPSVRNEFPALTREPEQPEVIYLAPLTHMFYYADGRLVGQAELESIIPLGVNNPDGQHAVDRGTTIYVNGMPTRVIDVFTQK